METRGGKILEFLKENSHLDLEVPDIAFNVKKSEKTVEAALLKFQQKGLVTARQNEYGRVYWYALPSAPSTKTISIESIAQAGPAAAAKDASSDDEADLSELKTASPAASGKKGKKSADATSPAVEEEQRKPAAPVAAMSSPSLKPTGTIKAVTPATQSIPVVPKEERETITFSPEEIEPAETVKTMASSGSDVEDFSAPIVTGTRQGSNLPVMAALGIIGLLSLMALVRSGGPAAKIHRIEAATKAFVTGEDLKTVNDQTAAKISELEGTVARFSAEIDSLKSRFAELAESPAQKKLPSPAARRVPRKPR